jgi:hypothetical protein
MPLRICTGFEHGIVDAASLIKGSTNSARLMDGSTGASIVTTTPRNGSYCLRVQSTGAAANANYGSGLIGASQTFATICFGFCVNGSLGTVDAGIARVDGSISHNPTLFFRNSDDRLVMANSLITQNPQAGPVIVAGQWYWIELEVDISVANSTVNWWVDGVAQTQFTFAGEVGNVINNINIGGAADAVTRDHLIDDLLIWTDTVDPNVAPIGPHKVVVLRPDTGGTTAEIGTANATARMVTNSAIDATHNSANILAAIVEADPVVGASASGLGQRTSGTGNACGIPMTSYTLAAGEVVKGASLKVCCWANSATAAANTLGTRIFNGTTEDILFAAAAYSGDNTSSPAWISKIVPDGRFDTQAEINAMVARIGYSGDINPLPGIHSLVAELAVLEVEVPTVRPRKRRIIRAPSRNIHGGAVLAA